MVSISIFWYALCSIIVFLAGTLFKAITAAIDTIVEAANIIFDVVLISVIVVLSLDIIYQIETTFVAEGIASAIKWIIIYVVCIGLACKIIFGFLLSFLFSIVNLICSMLLWFSNLIFDFARIFEKLYNVCILKMAAKLDKC